MPYNAEHSPSSVADIFQREWQCMEGVLFKQDSYQDKCMHSVIWEDNCIIPHQNAIVALIIDLKPYKSPTYSHSF